jgi:hypothetical protein
VPNALEPEWIVEMNGAMDARSDVGLEVGGSTNRIQEPRRDNPLHFAPAFRCPPSVPVYASKCTGFLMVAGAAFCRRALDNPRISPILEELIGSGGIPAGGYYDAAERKLPTYRLDHVNLNHIERTPGAGLHNTGDGSSHAGGSQFFKVQDQRFFNGLLVVAYELRDTIENGGGFGCGARR